MQEFKKLKYVQRVLVFLLAFCIVFAGSSPDAMAKSKKAPAVKGVSLKIGKKKVTKKTYQMKQGEKKKIKVSVSPKKGKNVVQFATSNKKVATVSKNGTVIAKKAGTAKIKVTVRKGTSKKKSRASQKKTTWVKIKVVKGSGQKDKTDSETEPAADQNSAPHVTPKPEEPTPPPTETPISDETLPPSDSETPPPSVTPEPGDAEQGKSLIVYFSCTDTTKKIAEYVQEITGADIYRIEPEVPYTAEDLNYGDASTRATREQNDSSARPAIAGKVENMSRYQNIVIAYPIWWGQAPRIISTFLESYDFSGKTIVPVCTSHSSGIGSSATNLHALTDGSVTWLEGRRFSSTTTKEEVAQWLKDSGIQELLVRNKEGEMERVFDFKTKTVMLNSGYPMPLNGIGTYSLTGDTCVTSVSEALKRGVRLIDTAYIYHNEEEVGRAVRESGIPREDIFVITKLYPNQFAEPEKAINDAIEKLNLGYIDMMLLHHPGTDDVKAYKAMEKAVADGKIRSIGLSNWYVEELEEFLPQVSITPALVQNEIHLYYQENDVIPYIQKLGIVVQGWYPLGGRRHTAELLSDEVISAIAKAHGKSSAQVILRWNLQKGVVVIPGSSNPAHIQENTELYDFELTEEEMRQINALDQNEKHDWY
ncbi:MAG: aldo/keto reductase [Lachnospiraceae bacterium]|nr:aldo/keto reductase [Lachnospiraceae bacterium]